ncbi:MAG TPA: hypothetical protein VFO16_21315 [Pseudonocardiaceae bacterium]|nr:hypothetical protein [Pseudonocardiaceae bacterium]
MADGTMWSVECEDVGGRSRLVVVGVTEHRVSLRTPPGETAIMTWTATEELRRLLAFAVAKVLHDETT